MAKTKIKTKKINSTLILLSGVLLVNACDSKNILKSNTNLAPTNQASDSIIINESAKPIAKKGEEQKVADKSSKLFDPSEPSKLPEPSEPPKNIKKLMDALVW